MTAFQNLTGSPFHKFFFKFQAFKTTFEIINLQALWRVSKYYTEAYQPLSLCLGTDTFTSLVSFSPLILQEPLKNNATHNLFCDQVDEAIHWNTCYPTRVLVQVLLVLFPAQRSANTDGRAVNDEPTAWAHALWDWQQDSLEEAGLEVTSPCAILSFCLVTKMSPFPGCR